MCQAGRRRQELSPSPCNSCQICQNEHPLSAQSVKKGVSHGFTVRIYFILCQPPERGMEIAIERAMVTVLQRTCWSLQFRRRICERGFVHVLLLVLCRLCMLMWCGIKPFSESSELQPECQDDSHSCNLRFTGWHRPGWWYWCCLGPFAPGRSHKGTTSFKPQRWREGYVTDANWNVENCRKGPALHVQDSKWYVLLSSSFVWQDILATKIMVPWCPLFCSSS